MISFCGYNFCRDKDSLNPFPTNVKNIKEIKIENGIFNHINVNRNIEKNFNQDIPKWDFDTIMDCDFKNGVYGGNVEFTLNQLTSLKVKRRKKQKYDESNNKNNQFNSLQWISIKEIPVNNINDLDIVIRDYIIPSGETFEWALVPVLNGIEGEYIIGSLLTNFNGVFISDVTNCFKLDKQVSYGGITSIQEVGKINTLGKRYPIIIKNGNTDYEMGTISGTLLGQFYDENHILNRNEIVKQVNSFNSFLKNGKPKIIKDWNGNIWMVYISGNVSLSYNNNYGMGIANTSFEWTEQGKYDNETDLYNNGFINEKEFINSI